MTKKPDYDLFLVTTPGLEPLLAAEAREKRIRDAKPVPGGVTGKGGWDTILRANLELRGANRVLVRLAAFRAAHLAELDKKAREVPWAGMLRRDVPFRVEATCTRSKIYHSGAAAERIARAIRLTLGAPEAEDAPVTVMARIEKDHCTVSVDTSGELLHKRGHKEAVAKAPMRETMAALLLRQCAYDGSEPVVDPVCGSGTFVIEAAEIAAGLKPGRSRHFAFEKLAPFDPAAWEKLRSAAAPPAPGVRFHGSDRDAGAIRMARSNAAEAGIGGLCTFEAIEIRDVTPPGGAPGLVILNPPYGTRLGDKAQLRALYRTIGKTLLERFQGWRVGLVTADAALAKATGLPFTAALGPFAHGGLRVGLHTAEAL